jgi:hypothetical protein
MLRFTSKRERHLWGWVLAILIAIYSTVGLAGTLAQVLREQNLLGVAFALAFLCVIVAVIGIALHHGAKAEEVWVVLGVAAVYGMIVVRMGLDPIERTHLFEYGLLAVLIYEALVERKSNSGAVPVPGVLAVLLTALLGWIDEGIQAVIPNRTYDVRDAGVNALAGFVATTASATLAWLRQWRESRRLRRDSPS